MLTPDREAERARKPMGRLALFVWAVLGLIAFVGFLTLGNWQVERRAWKHDLIERVQARIHADAVPAPLPAEWSALAAAPDDFEYRRVQLQGRYLHAQSALVQASTVLGSGYWLMTPLQTADDGIVFINRGFLPRTQADGPWRAEPLGDVTVTGLLRLPETGGAFLRDNQAEADRWFSRDVAQIAAKHGLPQVAPYFVDAEATEPLPVTWTMEPPSQLPEARLPVAGLTVISFKDNHLTYLLTWYGLALMVALAAAYVIREERRARRSTRR